jgi:hypothetical protein
MGTDTPMIGDQKSTLHHVYSRPTSCKVSRADLIKFLLLRLLEWGRVFLRNSKITLFSKCTQEESQLIPLTYTP